MTHRVAPCARRVPQSGISGILQNQVKRPGKVQKSTFSDDRQHDLAGVRQPVTFWAIFGPSVLLSYIDLAIGQPGTVSECKGTNRRSSAETLSTSAKDEEVEVNNNAAR